MNNIKASQFIPLTGKIFVTNMEKGMQLSRGGIIRIDDNFKDHGIRPRWSRVWKIGSDIDYLNVGEWVLVEHGRWTLQIDMTVDGEEISTWSIDPSAILLVSSSEECPADTQYTFEG
jgi:hypothetical protein